MEIVFWIRIFTSRGVCFIQCFDLRLPYMFVFIVWNFRGLFWVKFFVSQKSNCILKQNFHFWRVCFNKLCYLTLPYISLLFFWTLSSLFWVWFLVFENVGIVYWIRIPTFWVQFYNIFLLKATLFVFFSFFIFRRHFLSLILGFWKLKKCIFYQNYYLREGLFYRTF